jgi:hypothetical protein
VAPGAACSPARAADGGTDALCAPGGYCLTGDGGTTCAVICDASGFGGGGCSDSQLCFNGGVVASFGVCLQVCGGDAGTACPSPTTCQQVDATDFACIP